MGEEEENRADSIPEGAIAYFRTLTQRDRSRAGNSSTFLSCWSHLTRGTGAGKLQSWGYSTDCSEQSDSSWLLNVSVLCVI